MPTLDLSFRAHASAVALLAVLVAAPTCGSESSSWDAADERTENAGEGAPTAEDTTPLDAGLAKSAPTYRGNPLCHVAATAAETEACVPDDGVEADCQLSVDASAPDADLQVVGCRLKNVSGTLSPQCLGAKAEGTDGVSCQNGADCAPGFDCVEGEGGSVCRRYCCLGSCSGQASTNGGETFCDVQRLVDTGTKAPVCMPIKHCELFQEGTCGSTETCAVVTENGDTGCVAIGPQPVGESCDELHCAAGLTCIGQAGNRKCYELCKVGSECSGALECKTSTIFQNPEYGVCQ